MKNFKKINKLLILFLLIATQLSFSLVASSANDKDLRLFSWYDENDGSPVYGVLSSGKMFQLDCPRKIRVLVERGFGFYDLDDYEDDFTDPLIREAYQNRMNQPTIPCKYLFQDDETLSKPKMVKIQSETGDFNYYLRFRSHRFNLFQLGCQELAKYIGVPIESAKEWDADLLEDFPAISLNCYSGTEIKEVSELSLDSFQFATKESGSLNLDEGYPLLNIRFNQEVSHESVEEALSVWKVSGNGEKSFLSFQRVSESESTNSKSTFHRFQVLGKHEGFFLHARLKGDLEHENGILTKVNQLAEPNGIKWPKHQVEVFQFGFKIKSNGIVDDTAGFALLELVTDKKLKPSSLTETLKIESFEAGVGSTLVGFDIYDQSTSADKYKILIALQGNHSGKTLRARLEGSLQDESGEIYPILQDANPNNVVWEKTELTVLSFQFQTTDGQVALEAGKTILTVSFNQPVQQTSVLAATKILLQAKDQTISPYGGSPTIMGDGSFSKVVKLALLGDFINLTLSAKIEGTLVGEDGKTFDVNISTNPRWVPWMSATKWIKWKSQKEKVFIFYYGSNFAMFNNNQIYALDQSMGYGYWAEAFGLTSVNTFKLESETLFHKLIEGVSTLTSSSDETKVKYYEYVDLTGISRVLVSLQILGVETFELSCLEQYDIWQSSQQMNPINLIQFDSYNAKKLYCGDAGTAINEAHVVDISLPEGYTVVEGKTKDYVPVGHGFKLRATKPCYPDIVEDHAVLTHNIVKTYSHPDLLNFEVQFVSSTPHVEFRYTYQGEEHLAGNKRATVSCGSDISVKAFKIGHVEKSLERKNIKADETLNFGALDRISFNVKVTLPAGYTLVEGSTEQQVFYGDDFKLVAKKECYPDLVVDEKNITQDIALNLVEGEKYKYEISLFSTTSGVSFDQPNPSSVTCGEPYTATASKEGYESKSLTINKVDQDMALDFGSLTRLSYEITLLSNTASVNYYCGWSPCANPMQVFHGESLTVEARATGYQTKSLSLYNITSPETMDFGDLDRLMFEVYFTSSTSGVTYSHDNPTLVYYGDSLTVTASKSGYQDKTKSLYNITRNKTIHFGYLQVLKFKVTLQSSTPGVKYKQGNTMLQNPFYLNYGQSITVTAFKNGYKNKNKTISNISADQTLNFGALTPNSTPNPCKGYQGNWTNSKKKNLLKANQLWKLRVFKQGNGCYMEGTKKNTGKWVKKFVKWTGNQGKSTWKWGNINSKVITIKNMFSNKKKMRVEEMAYPAVVGTQPLKWVFNRVYILQPIPVPIRPIVRP